MTGEPYQVMPPLAEPEYDALKASIAAGYDPARPIVVDENGVVLDGHHRQRAAAELGITPPVVTLPGLTEDQKHDYAMRANLACRHLTQAQKRELIGSELERNPGRSDREIGRLCGADHKTVGAVRRGEIPHPADDITTQIKHGLEEADMKIMTALLAGVPSAMIAAELAAGWDKVEHETAASPELGQSVRDVLIRPRLEALEAWPTRGLIADRCMETGDELRDIYTTRLATGLLS